ncbi:unnamed protein product [Phytomonas sp. EM1]|nr:unnamed protein product [Phytomonas sp. EM1]|eukprot:CCW62506.1 unnamed protein product [Phytomonas sp. isolate EM1]
MVQLSPKNQVSKRAHGHTTSVTQKPPAAVAGLTRGPSPTAAVPSPLFPSLRVKLTPTSLDRVPSGTPSALNEKAPLSSPLSQRRVAGRDLSKGGNSPITEAHPSATQTVKAHDWTSRPPNGDGLLSRGEAPPLRAMSGYGARAADPSNWSQVVLGVTSGLVFVFVVGFFYTIFTLVRPYGKSIATSVFLSIVLHPQNRPLVSLNVECCMDRMRRMQHSWAKYGSLFYIIGSWFSLVHFISFVMMQCVIFLGLDKMRISWPQRHGGFLQRTKAKDDVSHSESSKKNLMKRLLGSTLDMDYYSQSENNEQPQLLVATKEGRLFLRCLTVCVVTLFFYILLGIRHFVLMHVILLLIFAFLVLFMQQRAFIENMTHLWKMALFTILLVGLFNNFTMDILMIRDAVKRTKTSVVLNSNVMSAARGASGASSTGALCPHKLGSTNTTGEEIRPLTCTSIFPQSLPSANSPTIYPGSENGDTNLMNQSNATISESDQAQFESKEVAESLGVALNRFFSRHKDTISDYAHRFAQSVLLQELGVLFNQTNTTELEADLRLWVSLWSESLEAGSLVDHHKGNSIKGMTTRTTKSNHSVKPSSVGWSWWRQVPFQLFYTFFGSDNLTSTSTPPFDRGTLGVPPDRSEIQGGENHSINFPPFLVNTINWSRLLQLAAMRVLPFLEHSAKIFATLSANLLNLTDTIYSFILFVLLFRYFSQLEYSLLYYAIVKVLVVEQREYREYRAQLIEREITLSFITLLQSFWHLTWFHFAITFTMFKWWGLPTPFFCGVVAVLLILFPLSPKWLSPCSIALLVLASQTIIDNGIVGVLCDLRVLSFLAAVTLDYNDNWLLRVTQGPSRDPHTGSIRNESKQFPPFVVGTMVVLGFVAYGAIGILLGPLIAIIAKVFFDNWEIELPNPPPLQPSVPLECKSQLHQAS